MRHTVDLAIVGSGPAGISAATEARLHGLSVLVIDEQPAPGGQIWRGVERNEGRNHHALGKDYRVGIEFVMALRASGAHYMPDCQIWQIESGFTLYCTRKQDSFSVRAARVILATGAQERPVPFPGWTLPGVMTVGAAQILLKTPGEIPSTPVWVAGSGPLPLLYLTQLRRFGGRIGGYLDTTPVRNIRNALPFLPQALRQGSELLKGLSWIAKLQFQGIPTFRNVRSLEAEGEPFLKRLHFTYGNGKARTIETNVLLVHEGVIPSIHMSMGLGCEHSWNEDQQCFVPVLDRWGHSSTPGLFVAGDGAGIGGAKAAVTRGRLAAIGAALSLDKLRPAEGERFSAPLRRSLDRSLASRPFLDQLFRPREDVFSPPDETLICRCEEITAAEIRALARIGSPGPNQLKSFTRAGMGPCQGRQCGYTVAHILASTQGRSIGDVGYYRIRPPFKPVTLGELTQINQEEMPL